MTNQDDMTQPRVIAQLGDDGAENASRLIWTPPRPMTAKECEELNYPPGTQTKGEIVAETTSHDALGAPFWLWRGVIEEHQALYALVLKLHSAFETAWDQRESITARMHDMFNTLVRDGERFADLMRKIEALTDRVAAPRPAPAALATDDVPGAPHEGDPAVIEEAKRRWVERYRTPSYEAAADASCETVTYRARRIVDQFFADRHKAARHMNADVGRAILFEISYAMLEDCEQAERLRQKAPRDTAVGYTDPERPHIVNGEFQSDKYPTTPRGKVPLSVKDAAAQDLLWEYAQRRRSVDAQFADDLEYALKGAGYAAATPPTPPTLWVVTRASTARFLGVREWVRTIRDAAHFVDAGPALEAADTCRGMNTGVAVESADLWHKKEASEPQIYGGVFRDTFGGSAPEGEKPYATFAGVAAAMRSQAALGAAVIAAARAFVVTAPDDNASEENKLRDAVQAYEEQLK